jgi:hypothetical protein
MFFDSLVLSLRQLNIHKNNINTQGRLAYIIFYSFLVFICLYISGLAKNNTTADAGEDKIWLWFTIPPRYTAHYQIC